MVLIVIQIFMFRQEQKETEPHETTLPPPPPIALTYEEVIQNYTEAPLSSS